MTPALRQNLTLAVLVLTGINMRPLLTSIGPLLPDIRAASGMSYTLAALLTALPVIAMGVLALAAGWVDRYIGQKRSIALSLLIIAAGALLRKSPRIVAYCSPALWPEELASALFRPPSRR
jgi:CP family cyanate transporter-like MFS transporter